MSAIIENVLNSGHCVNLRLGDVGAYIRGLTYNSNDVIDYNGTLVMRSNNIINGSQLDYNNNVVSVNKQISQEQQLQDGDIVICMANGSSALVGKSSFYDGKCLSPITVGAFISTNFDGEHTTQLLFFSISTFFNVDILSEIFFINSGLVPQHPPIIDAPN